MTTLTISIVTYHSDRRILSEVLESLSKAVANVMKEGVIQEAKLVIVDNGDEEAFLCKALLNRISFEAKVIASVKNIGFGRAHNLALKDCESDLHLVLNPDAVLEHDALTIGCRYLSEHSGTVMVAPYVKQPSGSKAYLCKRYPSVLDLILRGFNFGWITKFSEKRLANYECRDYSDTEVSQGIAIASGCYMLVRTDSLKKVQGFDEAYFLYFEDFDLSQKLCRLGSIDYLPQMRIMHYGGNAYQKGIRHIIMFCRSAITFFNANGWKLK